MGNSQKDNKTGRFLKLDMDEDELVRLYNVGISESSIAKLMGYKQQTISNRLRKLGLQSIRKKLQPMIEKDNLWLCERCDTYKNKSLFIYDNNGKLRFRFCKKCKHKLSTESTHKTTISYIRNLIRHKKYQLKDSGVPFDIDADFCLDLWNRQLGRCFYTDVELTINNTNKTRHNHHSASLDKIIPELGYVKNNVVWCQQRINVMKNDATINEMKKWMPDWYRRLQTKSDIYKF